MNLSPFVCVWAVLAGCVLWVPVGGRTAHGLHQLWAEHSIATVLPDGMSREDVLGTIGGPDRVLEAGRRLLWVGPCHESSIVVITTQSGGEIPLGHDYVLLVEFDARGRLVRRRFERTCYGGWPGLVARMLGSETG